MTKYRACYWYEKVYRNSKFDRKNMERSETSTTVWPCSKTEPVSPLSVCGDYLEHFRGILDVQEYNINTIQINIRFGWIWCTGYLSKTRFVPDLFHNCNCRKWKRCNSMRHRFLSWLFWSWLSYTSLNMNIFITFSEPFTFRFLSSLPFFSLFLSLLVFSVLFPFLVFTLVIFIFLFFRVLLWSSLYLVLVLSSFPLLFFAFVDLFSCSSLPDYLALYCPFFSGHVHFFFPFSVFNIAPLILVCANFKLRKSKVSQPNFHCTLIYILHQTLLRCTFSNIFWFFFDISTRGFLSGPGSYQPCLRGNDRVGQINDSSTDVQFKLYKLFNGQKYGINEYCMNFNK